MERIVVLDFLAEFPRFPGDPRGLAIRFRCPADGCGWLHDERPDLEPAEPLRIPLGPADEFSAVDGDRPGTWGPEVWERAKANLDGAISAHADARQREFWQRVTEACSAHVIAEHPAAGWTVNNGPQQRPARPVPTYPYPAGHSLEKVARFACPRGCGWTVDVSRDLGAPRMETAPPERIGEVQARLQAQATRLVEVFWSVVTGAIDAHVAAEHADAGGPPEGAAGVIDAQAWASCQDRARSSS